MLTFKKLVNTNLFDLSNLRIFYDKVLFPSFDSKGALDTYDSVMNYFLHQRYPDEHEYSVVLAYDDGVVIGGCIYNYFSKLNTSFVEYLAVDKKYFNNNIGTMLFEYVSKQLETSAINSGYRVVDYIFAEMYEPEKHVDAIANYEYFGAKLGFKKLNANYVKPVINSGEWCLIGINNTSNDDFDVNVVYNTLVNVYKCCVDIEVPFESKEFTKTVESFSGKRYVSCTPLLPKGK